MDNIRKVVCWLCLICSWNRLVRAACDSAQADVIFLIDASGSVQQRNFDKELRFAADFSNAFDIGPSAVQVGVITFSDSVKEEFNLQAHGDKDGLIRAIKSIRYTTGYTYTNLALQYAREHGFTIAAGDRTSAPNIVILLTDGQSNEPDHTKEQAEKLRNTGVEIYAIGIGKGIQSTELDTVASNHNHVYMVENFDLLAGIITTIKDSLCQNLDPCSGFHCNHGGTCQKTDGAASCQCVPGYTGQHCDSDINECNRSNPCANEATCENTQGSYTCHCTPGYEGQTCKTDVDECSIDYPCHHGATCHNTPGSYNCTCSPGYIGQLCDIDIDECSIADPCLNGATCTNTPGSYVCSCARGFEGNHCQTDIDECATGSPCNHGTCIDKPGSFSCQCELGYQGSHCQAEVNECLSQPCQNGGVCFDGKNDYTCDCNPGFTGKNCGEDIDECETTPCQNGATCINGANTYSCQCVAGYTGTLCDSERDECASQPCQHGGTCTDLFNDYNCTCKDMIVGKNCQTDLCADVAPNCGEMFGVCHDPIRKSTICRGTCGVCGNAQIVFAGQTLPTTAATLCQDVLPNCGDIWGVCRDHAMAEKNCRKTCGACGTSEVVFG